MNQCVERFIVKHGKTGLLVDDPATYARAISHIRQNDVSDMTRMAREDTLARYALKPNQERMRSCLESCADCEKKSPDFRAFFGETPADWFLSVVEADKDCFLHDHAWDAGRIFHEPTKGSPRHYLAYFPDDSRLRSWVSQIEACCRSNGYDKE